MTARPIIGITGFHGHWTYAHGADQFTGVERCYTDGIVQLGGLPVLLMASPGTVSDALDIVDALILTGGADIDPVHYGHDRALHTGDSDPDRDRFEIALVREAVDRDIPTLAICRGHQLVNVAFGGHLHQHVEGHEGITSPSLAVHDVSVAPGSRLSAVVDSATVRANSLHHQAVAEPGDGLVIVAHSADGVVEATEHTERPLLSVQWHPERQSDSDVYLRLVEWLLGEVRQRVAVGAPVPDSDGRGGVDSATRRHAGNAPDEGP